MHSSIMSAFTDVWLMVAATAGVAPAPSDRQAVWHEQLDYSIGCWNWTELRVACAARYKVLQGFFIQQVLWRQSREQQQRQVSSPTRHPDWYRAGRGSGSSSNGGGQTEFDYSRHA